LLFKKCHWWRRTNKPNSPIRADIVEQAVQLLMMVVQVRLVQLRLLLLLLLLLMMLVRDAVRRRDKRMVEILVQLRVVIVVVIGLLMKVEGVEGLLVECCRRRVACRHGKIL
jgi:hypothetical protein